MTSSSFILGRSFTSWELSPAWGGGASCEIFYLSRLCVKLLSEIGNS